MHVDVQDLEKSYGPEFSLSVPELRIEEGATFGLVGNNGAGKTTLLRLLLDLIEADDGRAEIDGRRVDESTEWKTSTASYLDESFLIDFLTPDEYFDFVGSTYEMNRKAVRGALAPFRSFFTDEVLGQSTRYVRDLSMGNRKKVGLVAALFLRPSLLILDEPFANLDPRSQIQLKRMLRQLNEEQDTTMLISSHDLLHVTDVCRRIAILENGRIARDEETSEATLDSLETYFSSEAA
jgi:ABC-2 type transport system ATP-binding protein